MVARNSARLERRQRRAGAVDVVHAPAPEPRAVVLLLVEQPFEPARDLAVVARLVREHLEGVRGHVVGRLVVHLPEVVERDTGESVLLTFAVVITTTSAMRPN